jgi:prepilin-type N-terminal cleavage/methylation domain-containing protein
VRRHSQSGVTLIELLVVIAIASVIISLSFPSLIGGLSGVRLASASSSAASFLTAAMNSVERREQAATIVISPKENRMDLFTAASGETPAGTFLPPSGVTFEGDEPHRYMLFPGGAFPRISLVLRNENGSRRSVEIDPVTAVPLVRRIEDAPR